MASASCFPIFPMKQVGGDRYIDGGFCDNTPVEMAVRSGARDIVAIDIGKHRSHTQYDRRPNITYIRTYDGFLYLAVVLDLFSRQVVGWATRPTQHTDLVLQALLAAVWRRKPSPGLLLHSDQGTQFTSEDWQSFLREHDIVCSMSRRGNCHDNAAMESFFQLLKRERIKRRIYSNHDEARADVFQYIEMFYNPKRRHSSNDGLSPVEFEKQYALNG